MNPQVSIIIIFHDAEHFLGETIESVQSQSHHDWELILVDDGSTDGSSQFALSLASAQPDRIRYLEHAQHANRGTSASRNLGLTQARGQYVIRLDSDDVFASDDALAEQVALLDAHPAVALVYGPCQYWRSWDGSGADQVFPLAFRDEVVEPPRLLARMIESAADEPVSMMVRRESIVSVGGYDESIRDFGEDFIFAARLTLAFPAYASSQCWYRYRMHPDSYSHRVVATGSKAAHERVLLDWLERFLRHNRVRDHGVWKAFRRRALPLRHPRWVRLWGVAADDVGWLILTLRVAFQTWRRLLAGGSQASIDVMPEPSAAPSNAGLCRANVAWTVGGSDSVSIHVGAPDGPHFVSATQAGTQLTRHWVADRMRFFLQDATASSPNELSATLAIVRARVQFSKS